MAYQAPDVSSASVESVCYMIGETPTTPCSVWAGRVDRKGYGVLYVREKSHDQLAHRWVMAGVHGWGAIEGMSVEHACDNPACVKYEHLRLGTRATNMHDRNLKGRHPNSVKTHCKHGHEFTPENTYMEKGRKRTCRECKKDQQQRLRDRRKAGA